VGEKPFEGFAPTGPIPTTPSLLTPTYSPPPNTTDGFFFGGKSPGSKFVNSRHESSSLVSAIPIPRKVFPATRYAKLI
jgi:hypothetical protein